MLPRLPLVPPAALLLGGLLAQPSPPADAAGLWLIETGGSDMALAGAGKVALPLDAASAVANPATLQDLPGSSLTLAAVPLALDYRFEGNGGFDARASNREGASVLPAAYAAWHGERASLGFGAHSHFGLSYDSGTAWGGERAVQRAGLATFDVGPSIAARVGDHWVVGASAAAQWAQAEMHLAVANDAQFYGPPAGLPDGRLDFSGDDWSPAMQLGVTWTPVAGTRVGVAWTAPVDHTLALDVHGSHLHPILATLVPPDGAAKLDVTIPQQWQFGAAHESGATTVTGGLTWQDWSAFGDARLRLAGQRAAVFPGGLRDTWGASVGARRVLNDRWIASCGLGYENSPAPAAGVPAYLPVAAQWRLAGGFEHAASENLTLRASISVVRQGDATVNQHDHPLPLPGIPAFTGRYQATRVIALGLGADFRL